MNVTQTACSEDGCSSGTVARGKCRKHYDRDARSGLHGLPACEEDGCNRVAMKRGLCGTHYQRLRRNTATVSGVCESPQCEGFVMSRGLCDKHYQQDRKDRYELGICTAPECDRAIATRGVCSGHYAQVRTKKELTPIHRKDPGSWGDWTHSAKGYVVRRRTVEGARQQQLQHRFVMEQSIGRDLYPREEVHHVNGFRDDNRIENLELWSTAHPKGQRVEDKTAWAIEWLEQYAPERLA